MCAPVRCSVRHQLIRHGGNAIAPGCAVCAAEERRNLQPGTLVGQLLVIGAEHGGVGRRGLQTSFQHMADHRFATDVSNLFSRQTAGFQPGWDGVNHREGLIHWIA